MAYKCPRCEGEVQRSSSSVAGVAGGAVGALIYAAFASFECKQCGKLAKREFPPAVRRQMMLGTLGIVVSAIVILLWPS